MALAVAVAAAVKTTAEANTFARVVVGEEVMEVLVTAPDPRHLAGGCCAV